MTCRRSPSRRSGASIPRARGRCRRRLRQLLVSPDIAWSGNVRQLERAVERARERALARDGEATELLPEHFAPRDIDGAAIQAAPPAPAQPLSTRWQKVHADRATLEELEKDVLRQALTEAGGVVAYAAARSGHRPDHAGEPPRGARDPRGEGPARPDARSWYRRARAVRL